MVAVERLSFMVSHEKRALQHLEDRVLVDVRVREVDEHAGLRIAARVDVEVVSSARDAAADELAVVLEVHGIELDVTLRGAEIADPLDHLFPLLRCGHELRNGVVADRHVVEVEAVSRALGGDEAQELLAGDGVDIRAGVADRRAEDDAVLLEQVHRLHDRVIVAGAAARVVRFGRALNGEEVERYGA